MTNQLQQARARLRPHGSHAQRLLPDAPDEHLVGALRRGDERAFETIYDRHHRALLGFCRHMLGSREEAEDALQQVFVSAHRHLVEETARVELKPWLYAIARNRCLSMLRARRDTYALEPQHEPSTEGLAVADEVERREDVQELLGDLGRLPDDQRAALLLAELGDLSQREIAEALDVHAPKVKALIFQAREALSGWRQARATDCREIQEQLATLRGSALRRAPIRRHVALCPTCEAFEREVSRQRAGMALLLPVVPTAALKSTILSSAVSAGNGAASAAVVGGAASGAAVSGAGVGVVTSGASGFAVKALAAAALAIGAGGGGAVAVRELDSPTPRAGASAAPRSPVVAPAPAAARAPTSERGAAGVASPPQASRATPSKRGKARGRSADAPGRSNTQRANGRGTRRGQANQKPRKSRPAPATSRRPDTIKPPAAKAPRGNAPAAKPRVVKTPPANGKARTSPPGQANPATPASPGANGNGNGKSNGKSKGPAG